MGTLKKPLLFIDTEFNGSKFSGFGGELISMALVGERGSFYEAIQLNDDIVIDPWAKENVIPVINKKPIPYKDFQTKLHYFLDVHEFPNGFTVVADWPDDIKYFCESIIIGAGLVMNMDSFDVKVNFRLGSEKSKIPHNALEDAISIRDYYEYRYSEFSQ